MPIDYKKYPSNWKTEIRPYVLNRSKHRCEFCKVKNYTQGYWEALANKIDLSMPESLEFFEFKLEQAIEIHRQHQQVSTETTLLYICKKALFIRAFLINKTITKIKQNKFVSIESGYIFAVQQNKK